MTTRTTGPLGLESLPHDDIELVTDVLVIGGGPAGTWAAIKAREAGAEVAPRRQGLLRHERCDRCGRYGRVVRAAARRSPRAGDGQPRGHERVAVGSALDAPRPGRDLQPGAGARRRVLPVPGRRRRRARARRPAGPGLHEAPAASRHRHRGAHLRPQPCARVARRCRRQRRRGARPASPDRRDVPRDRRRRRGRGRRVRVPQPARSARNVDTGDSYLLGAEVGAEFSGMEFSNSYSLAPAMTSVTKSAYYFFSTFYREDGSVLEGAGSQRGRSVIARTLLDEPVFCQLDQIEPELWGVLRDMQPNFFQPFDRVGIDPFTQRFPVTLILEGTVRGTGGLRIVDDDVLHHRARPVRRRRRGDARVDLRSVHRWRQPQLRLGDLVGDVGRPGCGAARARRRRRRRHAAHPWRRDRRAAPLRQRRGARGVPRRHRHRPGRGPAVRQELLPHRTRPRRVARRARQHVDRGAEIAARPGQGRVQGTARPRRWWRRQGGCTAVRWHARRAAGCTSATTSRRSTRRSATA